MLKKTSLKNIAVKVGVSTALVSSVINGKGKGIRVSAEMANKAVKIIMDYFSNTESPKISQVILESKLIIRSSSG
jgi:LacI family transcriptional regulator